MKLAIGLVFVGAVAAILAHESAGESVVLKFDPTNDEPPSDGGNGDGNVSMEDSPVMDTVKNAAADVSTALWGTKYDSLIANSEDANGLPRGLLYRLLYRESHFRQDIIDGTTRSRVGALGIAQFMPATAIDELGSVNAALDPNIAIPGAARYLAKLIRTAGGSIPKGVAAYNWGIGNVLKKGLDAAPNETKQYVAQIAGDYTA